MANLAFMTGKYIFEAALLNFFLAWGLLKRPAAAVRTAARFWWLFLTSGLLQGLIILSIDILRKQHSRCVTSS